MASRFSEDIKSRIRSNDPLTRLIIINLGIFILLGLLRILTFLSGEFSALASFEDFVFRNLALPLNFHAWLHHPWTLISYMFTQIGFFHLFWNMVNLFWFGKILADFTNSKKLFPVYLYGGITGALVSMLLIALIPAFQGLSGAPLIGASAGVTAIIVAAATLLPNYTMNLLFLGEVKLLFVAAFVIFIDALDVASYSNVGGNLAHLGGALLGYIYIRLYKNGTDIAKPLIQLFDRLASLGKRQAKMKVVHKRATSDEEYNSRRQATQQEIDAILDKISRSGYESLSKSEKEILFKASKK